MSILSTQTYLKQSINGLIVCGICENHHKTLKTQRSAVHHFVWNHEDVYQSNKAIIIEQIKIVFNKPAGKNPMSRAGISILTNGCMNK